MLFRSVSQSRYSGLPVAGQFVGENLVAFNLVVGFLWLVLGLDVVDCYQDCVAGIDK